MLKDPMISTVNKEYCTGCQNCVEACPYDAIYFNETLNLAQKCTGCAHLLDQGWKEPRCVDACATGALSFIEISENQELFDNAEALHPEFGTQPLVVYYHLPKRFIAGAVYDPQADECLQDVEVVLTDQKTGQVHTALTDIFGDFWFNQIDAGVYRLEVGEEGFLHEVIENVSTEKDINVGDIALHREPVHA